MNVYIYIGNSSPQQAAHCHNLCFRLAGRYKYICIYMYIYLNIYVYKYMYISINIYMYMYINIYVYIYYTVTFSNHPMLRHMCTSELDLSHWTEFMVVNAYIYIYIYKYIYIYVYVNICIYIYIYIYIQEKGEELDRICKILHFLTNPLTHLYIYTHIYIYVIYICTYIYI
jgi:hypothetical protein